MQALMRQFGTNGWITELNFSLFSAFYIALGDVDDALESPSTLDTLSHDKHIYLFLVLPLVFIRVVQSTHPSVCISNFIVSCLKQNKSLHHCGWSNTKKSLS